MRRRRMMQMGRVVIVVAVLALVASAVPVGSVAAATRPAPARLAASVGASWLTYHHDAMRSGYDATQPAFTSIKLGWSSPATVDGAVYAEPLVFGSRVFVATENNTVYALDVATGNAVWQTHLGPPVPNSSLPCGNIDPVGITSTPVIDPAAGRIYVVGLVKPASQPMGYVLAAISLANGSIIYQKPITVSGLDPQHHIQRGALTLDHGFVYIPFGGRFGDCTPYHGWLVGASASGTGPLFAFQTSPDDGGGFWQPAGASLDSQGNLYDTSGNTFCPSPCTTNDGGENVFRLGANTRLTIACPATGCVYALAEADYFVPSNFASLDANDLDLGSTGPELVANGSLILQVGKAGDGYLLHTSALGHIGGQAFEAHVCPNLTDDAAFGGDAYADPYIYVPCDNGVVALTLDSAAPSFAFAWQGPSVQGAGPPIVDGGYVWTVDPGGRIYALNPTTGAIFYSYYIGPVEHFTTPAAGDGDVIVAAQNQIYAFVNGG